MDDTYIMMKDIMRFLDIEKGDRLFVSSDVSKLLFTSLEHHDTNNLNVLIDSMLECLGTEGTLIFPTYNWGFCRGKPFDYWKTKCKTGALGSLALKRDDFIRTKHPIYSFAVSGKDASYLYSLENKSSFGIDSPFAYFHEKNVKNLFIDVSLQHSLTYVHHVEEMVGNLDYRYLKDFTGGYIDRDGETSQRTYSMFVRDLDKDVYVTIDPIQPDFQNAGIEKDYRINGIPFALLELGKAYDIIQNDILTNRSRKLCSYNGQQLK